MKIKFNFLKKKKHFEKKGFQINPNIYWRIVLIIFFVFLIIISVFGFYLFKETSKEIIPVTENTIGPASIQRKDKLEKILEYFKTRENKSSEIINSPVNVVDPSL